MRKRIILIVILLLTNSIQAKTISNKITANESSTLIFDYTNATTAVALLEDSITEYNITFYGNGWSLVEISNWKNIGSITFFDDVTLNFTGIENTGNIYINDNSKIGFISSILDTVTIDGGSILLLDKTNINELIKNYNTNTVKVSVVDSTIQYLNSPIIVDDGDILINGLAIFGNTVFGMNISIDEVSKVVSGDIKIEIGYNNLDMKLIINGYDGLYYEFQINLGISLSDLEIHDVNINKYSYITNVHNFTMTNTIISDMLTLYNTNGTMNYITDSDNNARINIQNSNMKLNNSELSTVSVEIDGLEYNPEYKLSFVNTTIYGDFIWDALSLFYHENLSIGGSMIVKAVVNSTSAFWEETDGGINFDNVIKTTVINNLFDIQYNFNVLTGSIFNIKDSNIHYISSVNSTIIINTSRVMGGDFGYNSTVIINSSTLYEGFQVSAHSNFSFIDSYFTEGTYDWKNGITELYFLNTTVNANIYLKTQNLTAVNSHFNLMWRPFSDTAKYYFNFTNCTINKIKFAFTSDITYITMNKTIVNYWDGSYGIGSNLHIELIDTEILFTYGALWDWNTVPDLKTENTILNSADINNQAVYLTQVLYDDYTIIRYHFEDNVYGATNTGEYTVQRNEFIDGKWNKWQDLGTVNDDSFKDNSIVDGMIYAYRVLNHYNGGFMIYQATLNIYDNTSYLIPAGIPYDFTIDKINDRIELSNTELLFVLNVGMSTYNNTPQDTITVQFEYYKDGETGVITNTSLSLIRIRFEEEGNYTFRARVVGDTVRIWSDWQEVEFELYTIELPNTSITPENSTDEAPAFQITQLLSIMLFAIIIRKIGKNNKYKSRFNK